MYNPIQGTGSGAAPVVNITWPFIDRAHVKAKSGSTEVGLTWTSPSQVQFNVPVGAGVPWEVYRDTSRDAQLVDFVNGSVLTEDDLDRANLQLLYVTQEITSLILRSDLANLLAYYDALQTRVTANEVAIAGKAPSGHGHPIADVSGLQTALNGKAALAHGHVISDVTGLQTALDSKLTGIVAGLNVNVVNNGNGTVTISASGGGGGGGGGTLADGNYGDVTLSGGGTIMTVTKVGGVVPSMPGHTHSIANVTGLQTALDGKQTVVPNLTSLAGLVYAAKAVVTMTSANTFSLTNVGNNAGYILDRAAGDSLYAPLAHTHTIAQVGGLQSALDGKAGVYLPMTYFNTNFTVIPAHINGYFMCSGGTPTVTLDNGVAPGHSLILVNRSGGNLSLACAGGVYKNGATGTSTTGTLAPGGRITLIHEGAGVWTADGRGLS